LLERQRGAVVPAPDRGRGSGDCDEPRGDALLHDDARSGAARAPVGGAAGVGGKGGAARHGTPVRIWDLAERLIRMSGLRPERNQIVETDCAGRKLHEELWWNARTRPEQPSADHVGGRWGPVSGTRALVPLDPRAGREGRLHPLAPTPRGTCRTDERSPRRAPSGAIAAHAGAALVWPAAGGEQRLMTAAVTLPDGAYTRRWYACRTRSRLRSELGKLLRLRGWSRTSR